MKLEKFKEVLDTIRKTDNDIETLRKLVILGIAGIGIYRSLRRRWMGLDFVGIV